MADSVPCPECKGAKTMDYGMADSMGDRLNEWCDTCGGTGIEPPGHEEECASTRGLVPCDCGWEVAASSTSPRQSLRTEGDDR